MCYKLRKHEDSTGEISAVMRDWTSLCRTASVLAMVIHREPIPIGRMPETGHGFVEGQQKKFLLFFLLDR